MSSITTVDYSLGIDVGSSAVKVILLETETGRVVGAATAPESGMVIDAPRSGWAEQDPEDWWYHVVAACQKLCESWPSIIENVTAIGLSYQEHGLVLLDKSGRVIRQAIIWCDARAIEQGNAILE